MQLWSLRVQECRNGGRGQHWGEQEASEAPGVVAELLGQRRNRRLWLVADPPGPQALPQRQGLALLPWPAASSDHFIWPT